MSALIFTLITPLLFLTACAYVRSSYVKETPVVSPAKQDASFIQYVTKQPSRAALRIGTISTDGNRFADFEDLIRKAKEKAAKIGGDFILAEKSGVESSTVYSPGYSVFQSNAHANYNSRSGYGSSVASGYSVGPTISTAFFPWSVFSVWVYTPAQLGIRLDQDNCIVGFHLNSNAQQMGLQIGDRLIGVDSCDVMDETMTEHLLSIQPGDSVKLTVQRNQTRIEATITALTN